MTGRTSAIGSSPPLKERHCRRGWRGPPAAAPPPAPGPVEALPPPPATDSIAPPDVGGDVAPAAPSAFTTNGSGAGPSVAIAHYVPQTGKYATPDGEVYRQ